MVLDIIGSAALIAFGILSIYISIEGGASDKNLMIILLIGVSCTVAGSWLIIQTLTFELILRRLFGIIMSAFGLFLLIGFPDITEYQPPSMSRSGMLLGLFILIIGLYFLFF